MNSPNAPEARERRHGTLLVAVSLSGERAVSRQSGFTLVELMVAMALGLLILVVMVTIFANTSAARGEIDKSSRQIENGRFALQILSDEIRHAGYYGPMLNPPGLPLAVPDPCLITTAAVQDGLGLAIQGFAPVSSATAPSCLQTPVAGYRDGTAVVVVRRAFAASATAFSAGDFNIQVSGCPGDGTPFTVGTVAGDFTLHSNGAPGCKPLAGAPTAAIAPLYVRLFFVSNCSAVDCTGGGDSVPTLKRMDVKPGGVEITPVVDGIENLQVDYGRDTDGNGSPDIYDPTSTPPTTVANWDNVMAARVYVLARNVDASGGHSDTKTYSLGDVSYTPTGNDRRFKRHAYSELVRLNNPAGRRE
jgi:type IV pilus assembly protein PilW